MLKIIVACGKNGVIGVNGQMPWHLPRDLAFFKAQTIQQTVIMGRKTYESIGKALPSRQNIVISSQNLNLSDALTVRNPSEALSEAKKYGRDIFIIGGAQIYRQFIDLADELFITEIQEEFNGDAYFPAFEPALFTKNLIGEYQADEKNAYALKFFHYLRKSAFSPAVI